MATFKEVLTTALDRGMVKMFSVNRNLMEVSVSTKKRPAFVKFAVTDEFARNLMNGKETAIALHADGDLLNAIADELDKEGNEPNEGD